MEGYNSSWVIFRLKVVLKMYVLVSDVFTDCEQSLFLENKLGRTEKSKRASVAVSVTCERRVTSPLACHAHNHARALTCVALFPTVFEEKRDCSQSNVFMT